MSSPAHRLEGKKKIISYQIAWMSYSPIFEMLIAPLPFTMTWLELWSIQEKKQVGQEGMQGFYFILSPMQKNVSLMSH